MSKGGTGGLPAGVRVGDVLDGTVLATTRSGAWEVALDAFPEGPRGEVGSSDLTWDFSRARPEAEPGRRIAAAVTSAALRQGRVRLSAAATAHPELWAFLSSLASDQPLTGTVALIRDFGVFVALDDGPPHPSFPGVGFVTVPELSWSSLRRPEEAVRVGQRVTCLFLQFDTTNGEARLSLRATAPDPFKDFADRTAVGDRLHGEVVGEVPFGVFVRLAPGIEGLIHVPGGTGRPALGEEVPVTVAEIDRAGRKLLLVLSSA
ncbi:S1 RNA-binding domain-containing protein [Nocardiopsis flavescens]|uniref:S1 RNA-binding domain-containing protein n=1 Tax=Nocardiopsis flavescens TaxID=758803 RepID=UPI00364D86C7